MKKVDLTGKKFGKLTVIEEASNIKGIIKWECICTCGNFTIVDGSNLRRGQSKSCGCLRTDENKRRISVYKQANPRLYAIWGGMKSRCYNPKCNTFNNYGKRGISVCDEWNEFQPFMEWALSSGYNNELTIDRKDVNGNYEPANCRWATYKEQGNNQRTNRLATYSGETKTITQWAEIWGVSFYNALQKLNLPRVAHLALQGKGGQGN